jgi:Beta/Gamma crystallin
MVNRTTIASLASAAVLAISPTAAAQRWEGGPMPREGACFYQDANYRGSYFCVESGDDRDTMPSGANDRVSSIRILGRAEVRIYKDTRFRGESLRLDSNVEDLESRDFNDEISSIQVNSRSSGGSRGAGGGSGSQNPERIVRRAYQDILEREPDQAGMRIYRSHIIDDGWTEQEVREDLRRSPEYRDRNTMTRVKAEEIVRQAYLSVLNREPDAASRGYVDAVFRKKMTREELERELRNSPEYRNRNR